MSHPSVEKIKLESRGLRGTLLPGLADAVTGSLNFEDQRLSSSTAATSRTTATCATNAAGRNWSPRTSS